MFNDLGFTLTPDSMISFQQAVLPLLLGSFLIIIGNTGFPCMLRFIIWAFERLVPRSSGVWEEFKFLLDHPRRCFTLLFPSSATWWLFWILVVLNGLDLLFFIILDVSSLCPQFTQVSESQLSSMILPSLLFLLAIDSLMDGSKQLLHAQQALLSSTCHCCTLGFKSHILS